MRAGAVASVPTYFPVIPGWDIAGVVEHAGLGAPEFTVGDEVIGYIRTRSWSPPTCAVSPLSRPC
jgi:NADPH:quinone reductase-like Zn-dependent oxidoreductase